VLSAFSQWAVSLGSPAPLLPVPEPTITAWLGHLSAAGLAGATIRVRLTAIDHFHQNAGGAPLSRFRSVRQFFSGLTQLGRMRRQTVQDPVPRSLVTQLVAMLPARDLRFRRDVTMLSTQFAAAMRGPSELLPLQRQDVVPGRAGFLLHVGSRTRTKTAVAGQAGPRRITGSAADVLRDWLAYTEASAQPEDFLFGVMPAASGYNPRRMVSRRSMASAYRALAVAAGVPSPHFGTHGVRRGRLSELAHVGASSEDIRRMGAYAEGSTVWQRYVEPDSDDEWRRASLGATTTSQARWPAPHCPKWLALGPDRIRGM
jgi:integrase